MVHYDFPGFQMTFFGRVQRISQASRTVGGWKMLFFPRFPAAQENSVFGKIGTIQTRWSLGWTSVNGIEATGWSVRKERRLISASSSGWFDCQGWNTVLQDRDNDQQTWRWGWSKSATQELCESLPQAQFDNICCFSHVQILHFSGSIRTFCLFYLQVCCFMLFILHFCCFSFPIWPFLGSSWEAPEKLPGSWYYHNEVTNVTSWELFGNSILSWWVHQGLNTKWQKDRWIWSWIHRIMTIFTDTCGIRDVKHVCVRYTSLFISFKQINTESHTHMFDLHHG